MQASACLSNCTTSATMAGLARSTADGGFPAADWASDELWQSWETMSLYFGYQPWLFSLIGSAMVGLSGIFPLLVIHIDEAADLNKQGDSSKTLKILLSFAVGGLLGDVFLHILPEAWANHIAANKEKSNGDDHATMSCGLWVLTGFLVFVIAEMIFSGSGDNDDATAADETEEKKLLENNNYECSKLAKNGLNGCLDNGKINGTLDGVKLNGVKKEQLTNGLKKVPNGFKNGYANGLAKTTGVKPDSNCFDDHYEKQLCEKKPNDVGAHERPKHISGYLNLMANCVDNFTHGLAVGGSFLLSFRIGALTTFAILIHEIPHEIGDFAILLKSGFSRWDAAKAQLLTATGGIFGAFVAVVFSGDAVESKTSWILPFTAGSFLHIGMVTVLPELLREKDPWQSLKQIGAMLSGIVVMALMTIICD